MLLSQLSELKTECLFCKTLMKESEEKIKLKCHHTVCLNCEKKLKKDKKENYMCIVEFCKKEQSNGDILKDLNTLDYIENNNVGLIDCEIHGKQIEYFSKSDKKFICIKCLSQFLEKPSNDIVHINSNLITKDLYRIRIQLEKLIKDIDKFSQKKDKKSDFLSNLFYQSINFFNALYSNNFEQSLDVFKKVFKDNNFGQSTIRNSKIYFEESKIIKDLTLNSKIINKKEDENFIRSLFDKKFDLALLYRASEHNFSAEKFHEMCDNKGSTLCLFKSEHNNVFGGFSDKSWFSKITFKFSKKSFLFSMEYKKKLNSFRNFKRSLFFSEKNGPSFGEDLMIGDKANEKKSSRSFLGRSYETCEGYYESYEAQKCLAGSPNFALLEYEVYQIKFLD